MRVLVLNCGSSSLKFDLRHHDAKGWVAMAGGSIDDLGGNGRLRFEVADQPKTFERFQDAGIDAAVRRVLELLGGEGLLYNLDAVGHRVVHGGSRFLRPTVIDDEVLVEIDRLRELAPLHNQPSLEAARVVRDQLKDVPAVAVFDTSFYSGLPDHVATYALPIELSRKHGIRRYGFHGIAHRFMIERYHDLHPGAETLKLVTLQLGSGCSATASIGGVPVETSMGFTPLEGLIMGTRSGDLDPAVPLYLAEKEGMSLAEVESLLNRQSGLLGLSGRSADIRDLLDAADRGDVDSKLALDAFCHRVRKYIGAYAAVLGGLDGIVFGGGIGQNNPRLRAQICENFEWLGLHFDAGRNSAEAIVEARISTETSAVDVWVMAVDEAAVIAEDVRLVLEVSPLPRPGEG